MCTYENSPKNRKDKEQRSYKNHLQTKKEPNIVFVFPFLMCFLVIVWFYQHQTATADRRVPESRKPEHSQAKIKFRRSFVHFSLSLHSWGAFFFTLIQFILFSLKSYSALLFVVVVVVIVAVIVVLHVVFVNNIVPILSYIIRVLFSSPSPSPSSLYSIRIPCFVSSAGWFLVFLFRRWLKSTSLEPEKQIHDTHTHHKRPKQQRRREGKRDIATSCCVFICTFFPFTLLFFKFPKLTFGINSFERESER